MLMNTISRKASILWKSDAEGGASLVATEGAALARMPILQDTLFGGGDTTTPAELVAAAHAGSFSLALSAELRATATAEGETMISATVTMENEAVGWTVVNIHLDVLARLPNMTQGEFIDATVRAKTNCLVSRLMKANISMTAKLQQ